RVLIWRLSWDLFRERPLLGWGPDSLRVAAAPRKTPELVRATSTQDTPTHAHNDLLQSLATTGLVGFAAYAYLLYVGGGAAVRAWRGPERGRGVALACGLLGLFLDVKFNPAPIEVLACAAFFAGLLTSPSDARTGAPPRRWPFYVLFGAATVSAAMA